MRATGQRLFFASLLLMLFVIWAAFSGAQTAPAQPLPLTTVTPIYGDEDARPLAMLTIHDPWAMVLGSDAPVFALYETGQVIYSRVDDDGNQAYWTVQLDEDERGALVKTLNVDAFAALDEHFDLALMTDQPTQVFTFPGAFSGLDSVSVYGSLGSDEDVREAAPDVLVKAYDMMTSFTHPDAEIWLPEKFEVIVWAWDTNDAADWPADLPQLDSPYAVQREMVTSVYVDFAEYERFVALVEGADALRMGGETFAFSVRWPFPHEVVWPTTPRPTATSTPKPA